MPAWLTVVIIIFAIYVALCVVAYLGQGLFLFHPEKLPESFEFHYDFPHEEIFIEPEEGTRINGLLFRTENSKGVVFYFKGNTRSVKGWGKFSTDFLTKGYDFFMIDYPGFGKSVGDNSEHAIYSEAQIAYKWLCDRYPEDKIVVYGRSFGAGFAARVASWNRPRMLILDSPYYSFRRLAYHYAFFLPMKLILRYRIPLYLFLKSVSCPVFILHGDKDTLIPYKYSVRLEKEFPDKVLLSTIPGGKHNNLPRFETYHRYLQAILEEEGDYKVHAQKNRRVSEK